MGVCGMSKLLFCVNLKSTDVDFMLAENRRFMYHPDGLLIMGAEDVFHGKQNPCLLGSHAEEYQAAKRLHLLPPYDEFIRGWIGVGKEYPNGIIHFAPDIRADNVELFDKAFDFIEAAMENGFSSETVLRGFPGAWEQPIGAILFEESLETTLNNATLRSGTPQSVSSDFSQVKSK